MSAEVIQYVEDLCDRMETLPEFTLFGKQLSRPASTAALRAFYYVEKHNNEKQLAYESLNYIMTDERCDWANLTTGEQIALLGLLGIFKVLVFY